MDPIDDFPCSVWQGNSTVITLIEFVPFLDNGHYYDVSNIPKHILLFAYLGNEVVNF